MSLKYETIISQFLEKLKPKLNLGGFLYAKEKLCQKYVFFIKFI